MDIPNYIKAKNKIYNLLLEFLESDDDDDFDFTAVLTNNIDVELKYFLSLLSKITKNHHRTPIFNKKINQILNYLSNYITKYLSNSEIFDIFKSNKQILYILFQNHILVSDEYVSQSILSNHILSHFFYPEIQKFINKEDKEKLKNDLQLQNDDAISSFEIKRQIGENDSYICQLIRNDSIEEFVSYKNRTNMNISSIINPSYYETNSFLLKKETISLIEYSAFFGSIQIFQYIALNNGDFTNDLWLCAIHGKNAEIIHHLESLHIEPKDKTYNECLKESIKCHHNEIAEYIQNNLLNEKNNTSDDVIKWGIQFFNYKYIHKIIVNSYSFFYFSLYNYDTIVNLYINKKKNEIEKK